MPRTRRSLLPLLLASLVAVTLAACAGTKPVASPRASTSTQPATSAQRKLVAAADPICATASARRTQANEKLGHATSLASPAVLKSIAETAPGVAAYEQRAVAKLRRLKAPAAIAQDWHSMLTGLRQLASATARLGADARHRNVTAAEKLLAGTQPTRRELLAIAERDGFRSCGRAD